jgi:hypothetical protein
MSLFFFHYLYVGFPHLFWFLSASACDLISLPVCFAIPFLGAFAKLRKATSSFVMSVHLFVRLSTWNNSIPTGWILIKFNI